MTDDRTPRPPRRPRIAGHRRRLTGAERRPGPGTVEPSVPEAAEPSLPEAAEERSVPDRVPVEAAPAPRRRVVGLLPWALAVLAVALSVGAGLVVSHERSLQDSVDARPAVVAAASAAATAMLSYDYHHLDQDFGRARQLLTPAFRKDYDETTKAVKPTAQQYHAVVTASVSAGGVTWVRGDTARVLLFVNQTSTNDRRAQPRIDSSRVQVTLSEQGGRWLVSGLRAL